MDNQDQILHQILETVGGIKEDVGVLKEDVGILKQDVNGLKKTVDVLTDKIEVLTEKVENIEENALTRKEFHETLTPIFSRLTTIEETMVTKKEFAEFKNDTLQGQDEMLVILKRLDQERVFTLDRVQKLEEDVKTIKLQLSIA